jgi:hypothetical protein
MRRLLGEPIPVVATIALRGGGFIAEVKQRNDVQVVEVTHGTRMALPVQFGAWIKQHARRAKTLSCSPLQAENQDQQRGR